MEHYRIQMENIEYKWKLYNTNRKVRIQIENCTIVVNTNEKLYNTNWKLYNTNGELSNTNEKIKYCNVWHAILLNNLKKKYEKVFKSWFHENGMVCFVLK
jgi:hypothetical protein